ncbi:PEPxxWA-CTERM sorting domain-containing protein [Sandaracinobacteroides saxicola]|uniref:PEP-CTERM sorting domain-containing protein n=1 Tax=Sandaracinobacteroides saxicola TaxID=2759707 RepID=A0A7G5IIB7_9SPHN|nr:PEPxxWA-CTERM sorting domain-containing protein [Sandaracinobacteroides saxicola]QMW23109.1 PEP-CTERM sorting domain-containing protein [Sandaracinobacteroides saxicola]
MMTMMTRAAIAALLLGATGAQAANLVVNGDFEAGNTGFSSGYTYIAPAGQFSLYPEGAYTVDTNANNVHNQWASYGDHTSGSGNYLIVNGAIQSGVTVWESGPIAVTGGTNYFFEAFASNMCCGGFTGAASNLTFSVIGDVSSAVLNTYTTGAPGVWQGFSNQWNSGGNSSVVLRLINGSTDFSGNDFAVDDINFGTTSMVPEPATWAMMILGFGLVGSAMRRRKVVAA